MADAFKPVVMVNVHTGFEVEAETALAFNNLAVNGYKAKNKIKKADEVPSAPKSVEKSAPPATNTTSK